MTYVVVDIEADGPDPAVNSMLCLAAAAVSTDLREAGTFTVNLAPRDGAATNEKTLAWFREEAADAYAAITCDPVAPAEAMARFVAFVESLPGPRIFVAHPLIFDGSWVDHYLELYTGVRLFGLAQHRTSLFMRTGIDLPSLIMGVTGRAFDDCHRGRIPEAWFGDVPHTHDALDDARGYASVLATVLAMQGDRAG
ncbi:DNA polymerase III subunit epsilon [Acuticoccus sediminis]|uniref:DNA polymerase III subunit epsilon n=1 Tax=Acuticoccus sediminis TaxID=2184697 RepID=A0A8B2NKS6_9HYPH|nr:DNA polymerase III subunit epsilon [Acuticoccus sediminis]RAH96553.1 DNA polymerase III subunit epsilon [Acuticoccus sediminis]